MYTKTIIAATLAGLAAAAPVTPRDQVDVTSFMTSRSTSAVHLQPVNENGLKFWIHKPTLTYCPPEVETCPNGTDSSITEVLLSTTSSSASLNVVVPGGQQLYVASDGSLSATQAHSADTGEGGMRGPFLYTPAPPDSALGAFTFNGLPFTACPTETDSFIYQVFALGYPGFVPAANCIWFNLCPTFTIPSSPAWEYI